MQPKEQTHIPEPFSTEYPKVCKSQTAENEGYFNTFNLTPQYPSVYTGSEIHCLQRCVNHTANMTLEDLDSKWKGMPAGQDGAVL